jgi:hypothetical protein
MGLSAIQKQLSKIFVLLSTVLLCPRHLAICLPVTSSIRLLESNRSDWVVRYSGATVKDCLWILINLCPQPFAICLQSCYYFLRSIPQVQTRWLGYTRTLYFSQLVSFSLPNINCNVCITILFIIMIFISLKQASPVCRGGRRPRVHFWAQDDDPPLDGPEPKQGGGLADGQLVQPGLRRCELLFSFRNRVVSRISGTLALKR